MSTTGPWDGAAVLLIDLQRDFLAADGAYARAGVTALELSALPARLVPVLARARAREVPIVSAQFTIVAPRHRPAILSEHLRATRPFLRAGDFAPGRAGHELVAELGPPDVVVEKVAFSAFHQSRLDWVLSGLGVSSLLVAGIVTNGGVASTVRDAHLRDLPVTLLSDGCAAFDPEVHVATLRSLEGLAALETCADAARRLS